MNDRALPLDAVLVDALLAVILRGDGATLTLDLDDVDLVDVRPFARACFDVLAGHAPKVFAEMVTHATLAWVSTADDGTRTRHAQVSVASQTAEVACTVSCTESGQVSVTITQSGMDRTTLADAIAASRKTGGMATDARIRSQVLAAALQPPAWLLESGSDGGVTGG